MKEKDPDISGKMKRRDGYVLREIMGEYILIPVSMKNGASSQVATLNEGGKFLWELLERERSIDELVEEMTREYDVSAEEARTDILEFVNHLKINSLLITEVRK